MNYPFGNFKNDGREFEITNPAVPRSFDNFLWNSALFSNVAQTGVGYCDYQIDDTEAVQLFTGNGRICDFDMFGRDNLMSRLIYIRDNETKEYWNVGWEPVCAEYSRYSCVHGLGYTNITSVTNGISSGFNIFVPSGNDPVELWTLTIGNDSTTPRDLSVFLYNQYQFRYKWGFDSYGDMLFRSSEMDWAQNAICVGKHPHVRPHDYANAFVTADYEISAFDGTREAFVGTYNTLKNPKAVIDGKCSNTQGSSDSTISAIQFNLHLEAGGQRKIEIILGVTDNFEKISCFKKKFFGNFDFYFEELRQNKKQMTDCVMVDTPDEHLNRMLNFWVKEQAAFGARWCRWGWMGYRDIVQHGYGVSSFDSKRTEEILLEAVKYQYSSGLALRGWNPIDKKPYSDSALWLVFTLVEYLRETGNTNILKTVVPFFDEGECSLLCHVERALDFLGNHCGAHNLCLIKFGDWNDSLTAVGKSGAGESVWLSEAYAEALRQMSDMYRFIGEPEKEERCKKRYEEIKEAINASAWDGEYYCRCFDDNGYPIGSHINEEGKIFAESQGWAMISGVANDEKTSKIIASIDKLLATSQGYKLLAPTFTKIDDHIGRISSMEPGICENGTIYTHVNIWIILGLLRHNLPDKAYEAFVNVSSGYIGGNNKKHLCPPYIYANCYYGPDHKNHALQMEFSWITGSIAWVNQVMVGSFLGVAADFNGLKIEPRVPSSWTQYSVIRKFRNATYNIHFKRTGNYGKITVDGNEHEGNILPAFSDGNEHLINVEF